MEIRERSIWAAVIIRILYDACGISPDSTSNTSGLNIKNKNSARNWLLGNSPDKLEVCEWAGIPSDRLTYFAKEMEKNGWDSRVLRNKIQGW
ncbi:MAG: hypothetical protein ACOC3T_00050 [Bacteroidota bacterium]